MALLTKNFLCCCNRFHLVRYYSKSTNLKVALCGAGGHTGQPLALMLKQSPYIDELALFDTNEVEGMAMELGHIDTKCQVTGYKDEQSALALKNAHVVVIANQLSSDYNTNFDRIASILKDVATKIAKVCPRAIIAVASTPVEATVPLISEVLKQKSAYDPTKIMGIVSLNVIRTNTFVAEILDVEPESVVVPVLGGSMASTTIPLLSLAKPFNDFKNEEIEKITLAVQGAHDDITKIKTVDGDNLSSAFATARFVVSIIKAIQGQVDVVECAFIRTDAHHLTKYVGLPILLGPTGVQKDLGMPPLSPYERCLVDKAFPIIMQNVEKARDYLGVKDTATCDVCDLRPEPPLCPPDWCEDRKKGKLH